MFLLGFYICINFTRDDVIESFSGNSCPNMLIQKGTKIYLYNSKKAEIPGVNPIEFRNLEEYVEFVQWQKSQHIDCPLLFLQKSYDTQGESIYRIRPSPLDPQGGLQPTMKKEKVSLLKDASRQDPPYNTNSFPSFDPLNQYVGERTPLDVLERMGEHHSSSRSAMDTNWDVKGEIN